MRSKFPVKDLFRLTWILSLTSTFFVFVYMFYFDKTAGMHKMTVFCLGVFLTNFLVGFLNLAILLFLERACPCNSSRFKSLQYSISFFLTSLLFFFFIKTSLQQVNPVINPMGIALLLLVSILINVLVLTLQHYVIIKNAKTQSDLENSRLRTANAEAANQLLKQQIHPHFLFNALNTLKSLYKKDALAAEDYLVHLSDFLRASVSYNNEKLIRLNDELKLCTDYIEMLKIRFGDAIVFDIDISADALENGWVPSFSVQPLIENAIKHNECTDASPLRVSIRQEGGWIRVTNNLQIKRSADRSTGSGLANLNRRYRMLSEYELVIEDTGSTFSVLLKILDYANSDHRG